MRSPRCGHAEAPGGGKREEEDEECEEEEEEEMKREKIRRRPGRKRWPRSASCNRTIHPWNIPRAHTDNVNRSANKGLPRTQELKKTQTKKQAVPCCFKFLPLEGSKRGQKNNLQTHAAVLLC